MWVVVNCLLLNGLVRNCFGGIFRFMYCLLIVYGFDVVVCGVFVVCLWLLFCDCLWF